MIVKSIFNDDVGHIEDEVMNVGGLRVAVVSINSKKEVKGSDISLIVSGYVEHKIIYEWNLEPIHSLIILEKSYSTLRVVQCIRPVQIFVCDSELIPFVRKCLQTLDPYVNILLEPLQPLRDNMDLGMYSQLEKDENKYNKYKEAIELAIGDFFCNPKNKIIEILFIGPGTGKLLDKLFSLNVTGVMKVIAIEKNPKCMETLEMKNQTSWNNQVNLIRGDASFPRSRSSYDLVISELLGSLGDNELAPEILQQFHSKIMIPSSYTSYIQPIYSPVISSLSRPYLCKLTKYSAIDESQILWEFPNTELYIKSKLKFTNTGAKTRLNGLQGHFTSILYGHAKITIIEGNNNQFCKSWYPIIFPFDEFEVDTDVVVEVCMERCGNGREVWYEWEVNGRVYNEGGVEYKVSKSSRV